jgi:hypothetical protein
VHVPLDHPAIPPVADHHDRLVVNASVRQDRRSGVTLMPSSALARIIHEGQHLDQNWSVPPGSGAAICV